ncbi:MAG: hypothetical protein GY847_42080 [Proteobacteria bacterium]|nr:hypothetical protein [Pseudomonadota bacterium]
MYRRQVGIQNLEKLALDGSISQTGKSTSLQIPIRCYGYKAPLPEDAALLAKAVPYFEFIPSSTSDTAFDLLVQADRFSMQDGNKSERDHAASVNNAFGSTTRFLVALSVATSGVFSWRRLSVDPREIETKNLLTGDVSLAKIEPVGEMGGDYGPIHAGHLSCAVDLFARIGSWDLRFFHLYSKGEMLLEVPEWPLLNFYEESYLCFFKCLEYVAMDRVLCQRGQLNPKKLANAFKKAGAQAKNLTKVATGMIAERGSKAAHMLKGYQKITLTRQASLDLKLALDALIRGTAISPSVAPHLKGAS